jgi:hypothetical protein
MINLCTVQMACVCYQLVCITHFSICFDCHVIMDLELAFDLITLAISLMKRGLKELLPSGYPVIHDVSVPSKKGSVVPVSISTN